MRPGIILKRNACFSVEAGSTKIIVDPCLPTALLLREDPDYVLVSHGHLDHAMNLRHTRAPIYGNKHIARFKGTDVCIDTLSGWMMGDIEVVRIRTHGHPHWLQRNLLYDLVMFPWSGIVRCGRNYGFVFKSGSSTVYYTSDTCYDAALFAEVQRTHRPDLVLYNVQPTWLWPRLLMTQREARGLTGIFSGVLQPIHITNAITNEILELQSC